MPEVKFRRLTETAKIPTKGTVGAAAFDLYADQTYSVSAGGRVKVSTGIAIELLPYHCAFILPRSGLACTEGITVANSPGLVDSDYRGEVFVVLQSHRSGQLSGPFVIEQHSRVAQLLVFAPVSATLVEVEDLSETARGAGGFGSTGR